MDGKKSVIIPCKVCGWDVEFDQVRLAIERLVGDLGDVPADVQARVSYLSLALKEAESQFRQLVEALDRHGLDLSDD
jgi:hypothetical protein